MIFNDALKTINAHKNIVGKCIDGAIIDELIIAPTNQKLWKQYEKMYIESLDAQQSVIPFINDDLEVFVVFDKKKIRIYNVFICMSLYDTLKLFNHERDKIAGEFQKYKK